MDPRRVGVIHMHSSYSHDGRDSLRQLRSWAIERGIGFVGMTDHAEDFDRAVFARFQGECASLSDEQVRLLPGLEWRFTGFPGLHLLGLGLAQWVAPATPGEFLAAMRGNASLTIVAHPVLPRYQVPDEVLEEIDAIEVWNANYNTRYLPDPEAIRLYHTARRRAPRLVATAGLDQHDCRNDRDLRVVLEQVEGEPLAALRAGRFRNRGRWLTFDAQVGWDPLRLAGLRGARAMFDLAERSQERVALAWRRWRARR